MKNAKIVYFSLIAILVFGIIIFLSICLSNPLVKKGYISLPEYLISCNKFFSENPNDLYNIAEFAYTKSQNDSSLEEYAEELYQKSASQNHLASLYKLGFIHLFKKNNEKKGIELLNRAIELNSNEARYSLALYYLSKEQEENEARSLELLKEASNNNFEKATKLLKRLDFGIDVEKVNPLLDEEKKNTLKNNSSNSELFNLF